MSSSPNDIESTFENTKDRMNQQWQVLFNELCYEVFYKNPMGKRLLAHLKNKYFRSPVAYPNRDPSWAFFNEGHNELIRSFSAGMQNFINQAAAKEKPTESYMEKRKSQTKPIS